ncbi:MAG: hypothetical protein HDKAJFGB_01589 [Anaerolineae bacterium]|nr:hypothetical protein [Anaerolineae bacterium]
MFRRALNRGSAGIAETQKARDFIERFARRIVYGVTEFLVHAVRAHEYEQRVSAAGNQRDERKDVFRLRDVGQTCVEPIGVNVTLKMIRAEQR